MMAINLEKGQKINLQKADGSSLQQIFLGVGWDVAKSKGFLGFGGGSADIDLDASVILFDENKQVVDVVYFGHLKSKDGSIVHTGDNRTGAGDGDEFFHAQRFGAALGIDAQALQRVQRQQQAGAVFACHGLPGQAGERRFDPPEQVEAGARVVAFHPGVGDHRTQPPQRGQIGNARRHQHGLRPRPQAGQDGQRRFAGRAWGGAGLGWAANGH